jgi:predicted DNA-binding transcriptional regulator AlpA
MKDSMARSRMLRPEALATRWQTTPGHLGNLRSQGRGPKYCKIGASVRYRLSDIEAYEEVRIIEPVA